MAAELIFAPEAEQDIARQSGFSGFIAPSDGTVRLSLEDRFMSKETKAGGTSWRLLVWAHRQDRRCRVPAGLE
jgi:hypothetical protein